MRIATYVKAKRKQREKQRERERERERQRERESKEKSKEKEKEKEKEKIEKLENCALFIPVNAKHIENIIFYGTMEKNRKYIKEALNIIPMLING